MTEPILKIMAVLGSLNSEAVTWVVASHMLERLARSGCETDVLDFRQTPLPLFNPSTAYNSQGYPDLKSRVEAADVFLLATPDYHGSVSAVMKNFLDHFWTEFAGKLFVSIVASHEKGLTVMDQLRTVARQCYAWTLPYGVSFAEKMDVDQGQIVSDALQNRLKMLAQDVQIYGGLLARQRRADLAGAEAGFMARYRS